MRASGHDEESRHWISKTEIIAPFLEISGVDCGTWPEIIFPLLFQIFCLAALVRKLLAQTRKLIEDY